MRLINFQCESASIEECVRRISYVSEVNLKSRPGSIKSSKISLSFGAFMNLSVTLLIDPARNSRKGILAEYSHGRNREDVINEAIEKVNSRVPKGADVVDFDLDTYTTPVTRRTYAVVVLVYNIPAPEKPHSDFTLQERRELLASVLREFNYNPRVLNISEIARMFNVSRDSIYYDIEQILKSVGANRKR